jgi:ribosomal protein S18 acetylase RimI-like enzyme
MAMKKKFSIREFKDFDAAEIFAIVRHVYLTSPFMSDNFDRKFPTIAYFSRYYTKILEIEGSFVLVAMHHKKPVGYLMLEANPAEKLRHTAMLSMGVAENFRGLGVGKFLLNEALDKLQTEGIIEIIYLMVRADHYNAVQLYKSKGFDTLAILDRDTKIDGEYFDGLLMRKFV